MSSHHIIREGQEPALFILDASAQDQGLVGQLLEWSPVVVVAEASLPLVLAWGTKIDAVVCHPDQVAAVADQVRHQQPVAVVPTAGPPAPAGLAYLRGRGQAHVHVVLPLGPAAFPQLRADWADLAAGFHLVFYGSGWKGHLVKDIFRKWLPAGAQLAVEQPTHLTGLTAQGGGFWASDQAGMVEIRPEHPIFVVERLG
jgi:thiamine pyrophosphokinase